MQQHLHLIQQGKITLLTIALACSLSACTSTPQKQEDACTRVAGSADEEGSGGNGHTIDELGLHAYQVCVGVYAQEPTNIINMYHMGRAYIAMVKNEHGGSAAYESGINLVKTVANKGYAPAQNTLGNLYENGMGVVKDPKQALVWYRKAADQGDFDAKANLARMYGMGNGVPKDEKKAMSLYGELADEGNVLAQYYLANAYYSGHGVEINYSLAAKWYLKAAENGHTKAQDEVGQMYQNGVGLSKDPSQAFNWYRKAAEKDNPYAQEHLAALYYSGNGTQKDYKKALFWYQKAAKKQLVKALISVAWMYQHGEGTPVNPGRAVYYYQAALNQGSHFAKLQLTIIGLDQAFSLPYGAAWGQRKHEGIQRGLAALNQLTYDDDPNIAKAAKEALAKIPKKTIDEDNQRTQEREYGKAVGGAVLFLFLLGTQCLDSELPDTAGNPLCDNAQ